jgi:hypothetical protein
MAIQKETSQKTLHITKPLCTLFLRALVLLVITLLVFEVVLQFVVHQGWMVDPGPGAANADLNIKLPMLDDLVKKTGVVDCIFLGSSMTNDDVDPEVFAQTYAEISGRTVTCFNFAVATLTGEIAGGLSRILVERYHPGLIIYGTSARDYSKELGARALKDDPWYLYKLGEWNLPGWLQEHSMLYREYLKLLSDLNPDNREYAVKVRQNTSPFGHYIVNVNVTSLEGQNTIHEKKLLQKDFDGVKQLTNLDGKNVRVVVVEIPVHERYLPVYVNDNPEEYYTLFFDPMAKLLYEKGIQFIQTITARQFVASEDEWADMKHLNNKGSIKFSAWLADEIWRLEQDGQLTWGEQ